MEHEKKYSISFMLSASNIARYRGTTSFVVSNITLDGTSVDQLRVRAYYEVQDIKVAAGRSGRYRSFANYNELQRYFIDNSYTMCHGTAVVDSIQQFIKLKSIFVNNTTRTTKNPKFFLNDAVLCGSVVTSIVDTRFLASGTYEYILELDLNATSKYNGSLWCPESILRRVDHFRNRH